MTNSLHTQVLDIHNLHKSILNYEHFVNHESVDDPQDAEVARQYK
jgi:hypothetical protein